MVCDPTGAGDCFGGGFMGYLAGANRIDNDHLKRAVIYGTVMASFCCEMFSVDSFRTAKKEKIEQRFREIRSLTGF
jgi:sugar/nucleoside kinase (ribokinase family)